MQFYLTAISLALALSGLAWGIFLTIKIFNIPDITTDGSFTLGAVVSAVHLSNGGSWPVAILLSIVAGSLAGTTTGIIHTKLKVNALLSGILVMTALYSVNLLWLGKSNLPLLQTDNLFATTNPIFSFFNYQFFVLLIIVALLFSMLHFMLKSDFGIAMRATGNAEEMAQAYGVNTNKMKIIGLAIANGLTALSGSLIAQIQQFADINMGVGIVIAGLGSVMIGEAIMHFIGKSGIAAKLLGVLLGCILFRCVIAFVLASGADPNLLRLITAGIVLVFVGLANFSFKKSG
jgi:putative ABC transport system permease protein